MVNRKADDSDFLENSAQPTDSDDAQLFTQAVLRLSEKILGFVLGILFALIIFIATNWLVIKGGPVVGPHLALLGQYFKGYSVSFFGSIIGAAYGFVTGYLSGLIIAWIYNAIVARETRE
ncbi:MAG: hypothetical protein DME75_09160 [Verrucomicrobia bacterium]|nr:MAG: hypothetical protein DME75_09160 [Verrucomicrobiota bacterium]